MQITAVHDGWPNIFMIDNPTLYQATLKPLNKGDVVSYFLYGQIVLIA